MAQTPPRNAPEVTDGDPAAAVDPRLLALARLLGRQAARQWLASSAPVTEGDDGETS